MIPRDSDDEVPGVRPDYRRPAATRFYTVPARGYGERLAAQPSASRVWREGNLVHLAIGTNASRFVEITAETDVQERRLARIAVETLGTLPHLERVALFEAMLAGRVQP